MTSYVSHTTVNSVDPYTLSALDQGFGHFDADVAGKMGAMDSSFSGHIPAHFEQDKTLKDAWISGYNGMASAMDKRCWSPPAPVARKARKVVAETDSPPSLFD